jgi:alkylation response protein AidB-like acyl-CoA dehydrogenase
VDFSLSPETVALRDQVRAVLAAHDAEEAVRLAHESGTNIAPALYRALGASGVIARSVVGIGAGDPIDSWVTLSELEKAALPYDALAMAMSAAAVVNLVGTDRQKERVLPGILAGESLVCFGLTEPDVGSDLPAVATRSQRVEDGWVISGTKMWTTMAHVADWCLLLTRSDPSAPPYRGYTFFLLPMSTPGITIEPIWTMSTERSNTMFLDGVRVADDWVLGEPEEGWATLGVMLSFERGMANTGFGIPLLRRAVAWAQEAGRMGDRQLRDELAQIAIENEVAKLLTQRTVWLAASGAQGPAAVAGSVAKIFATEAYQRAAAALQSFAGPDALLAFDEPGAAADGWIDYDARHSVPQTLQGGTSEINRNNIAERGLGLPRAR